MRIDMSKISFSRRGSFFVVSDYKEKGTYIRDVRGGDEDLGLIFKLELIKDGCVIPHEVVATESKLSLVNGNQLVELCIAEPEYLRIRGLNLGLKMSLVMKRYDHLNPFSLNQWELHSYSQSIKMMLTLLKGKCSEDTPWDKIGNEKVELIFEQDFELALESYKTVFNGNQYSKSFDEEVDSVKTSYNNWYTNALKPNQEKHLDSTSIASYITWSALVKSEGHLNKEAMYMSNNWMTNIWSWDHCFNAMALARNNPSLAYDQFIIFKQMQDESGLLPDFANDMTMSYSCAKPPIHGWCYSFMMQENDYFKDPERLLEVYDMLEKWTNFWLKYRIRSESKLPYYNHGNDSGWDNATIFDQGCPAISPDLASYLILQCETLNEIAGLLSIESDWLSQADELQRNLINELWKENRFSSFNFKTNAEVTESKSLINLMPIVIGHRLPTEIKEELVLKLKSPEYLTDFGLATEALDSPYYQDNGYWRGPIWAPTTMLIIDGLRRAKETELASLIAHKFCDMTLIGDMAENYNAKTGEGLVDPAFTWTSSVFLLLSNRY